MDGELILFRFQDKCLFDRGHVRGSRQLTHVETQKEMVHAGIACH